VVAVLSRSIQESLTALQARATRFRALSTDPQQSSASQIFFDDLRTSYNEAASNLYETAASYGARSDLILIHSVSQGNPALTEHYPAISQGVLRALEHNEIAYTMVAVGQSLFFDLDLSSMPPRAATALKRRGDAFKDSGRVTDCTVKSLPLAIWIIRFQKQGYIPAEREHDPFSEPNHVVNVVLKKQ